MNTKINQLNEQVNEKNVKMQQRISKSLKQKTQTKVLIQKCLKIRTQKSP